MRWVHFTVTVVIQLESTKGRFFCPVRSQMWQNPCGSASFSVWHVKKWIIRCRCKSKFLSKHQQMSTDLPYSSTRAWRQTCIFPIPSYLDMKTVLHLVCGCLKALCVTDWSGQQELRERVLRGKYRVPFYMSTDCEGILRRFLVLNPAKRCTLEVRTIM